MDLALTLTEDQFLLIQVGYLVGGLIALAIAATGFGQSSMGGRVINAIVGVACLGYAIYLFVSDPASVMIFWYVMLLPALLLVQAISAFFKSRKSAPAS